jgi:hypothetical protein
VGLADQRRQLGVGAEVRVDLGEVGDPVAVVAGRGAVLQLDRLVLEAGGEPDRARPHTADVGQALPDPGQVTPVVEALGGGVEARDQAVGGQPPEVVAGTAVLEPVGHHEVEVLAGERRPQAVAGLVAGAGRRRGRHRQQRGGEQDGQGTAEPGPHRRSPQRWNGPPEMERSTNVSRATLPCQDRMPDLCGWQPVGDQPRPPGAPRLLWLLKLARVGQNPARRDPVGGRPGRGGAGSGEVRCRQNGGRNSTRR